MNIQLLFWRQWLLGASMELARKLVNFVPLLCFIKVYIKSLFQTVEKEMTDVKQLHFSKWTTQLQFPPQPKEIWL